MTSISSNPAGIGAGALPGNEGMPPDAGAQAAQATARVRELLDAFVGMATARRRWSRRRSRSPPTT